MLEVRLKNTTPGAVAAGGGYEALVEELQEAAEAPAAIERILQQDSTTPYRFARHAEESAEAPTDEEAKDAIFRALQASKFSVNHVSKVGHPLVPQQRHTEGIGPPYHRGGRPGL
eukprot:5046142-Amphidinium_carterae.1